MSPEEQGLLNDVLDHPEEDDPRLIMADWLMENGEEDRAEFIRTQITLHQLHPDPEVYVLGTANLRQRERELFACHAHDLLGELPGLATFLSVWPEDYGWLHKKTGEGATAIRAVLRRGFVAEISLTCEDFMKHAEGIFSCHPIEKVKLSDREPVSESGSYWWVKGGNPARSPCTIPPPLWDHLDLPWSISRQTKRSDKEQTALDALGQAALTHGRNSRKRPAQSP